MGDIFICHTLYHVLIALVRALRSRPGKSTLVLSTCVPEAETLRAKLLDAAPDLWDAVLIVDEEKLDAQNSESDFYRLRHPFRRHGIIFTWKDCRENAVGSSCAFHFHCAGCLCHYAKPHPLHFSNRL